MHDQRYDDFVAFLYEKENIGIVRIITSHSHSPVWDGKVHAVFDVLAGYYCQLIRPELRHTCPSALLVIRDAKGEVNVSDLPGNELVRVSVYF